MRRFIYLLFAVVSIPAGVTIGESARRPRYGGALRVETSSAIRSLDLADWPADLKELATKKKLVRLVFDGLVRLGENGRVQSALAASWEHDSSIKRWTFHLRPGVKFHNGLPVTEETVAAAFNSAKMSWSVSAAAGLVTIEAETPVPDLLSTIAQPRHAVFSRGGDGSLSGTGPFRLAQWEAGRRAVLEANESCWAGRPFLDSVTVEMGRPMKDQLLDLELGRADFIEVWPHDARRAAQRGARLWTSEPKDLLALTFSRGRPPVEDLRLREALALSIDRAAIQNVLLQRQGDPTGALLPQWLSGYAFLFPASYDSVRARQLLATVSSRNQALTLVHDPADLTAKSVAERIAVNAAEVGVTILVAGQPGANPAPKPDIRLIRIPLMFLKPAEALAELGRALDLTESLRQGSNAGPEDLYSAERAMLDEFRIIPLFHLPEIYGSTSRLKTWLGRGVSRLGEWRFEELWLDTEKP